MRGSSVSGTRCGHRGQVLVPRKRESLGRSELNVGGSEHCEHGAGFITVVTDGVIGLRLNDDHVARTGGFLSTVDIDCALACNDEQNLFDVVGVCGHGLTAGEVVDEHGDETEPFARSTRRWRVGSPSPRSRTGRSSPRKMDMKPPPFACVSDL